MDIRDASSLGSGLVVNHGHGKAQMISSMRPNLPSAPGEAFRTVFCPALKSMRSLHDLPLCIISFHVADSWGKERFKTKVVGWNEMTKAP